MTCVWYMFDFCQTIYFKHMSHNNKKNHETSNKDDAVNYDSTHKVLNLP